MPDKTTLSIKDFITKLSKTEKTIAAAAICFIVLAVFDRLMFDSILSRINSVDQDVKTNELIIKKGLKILAQKKAIMAQLEHYSSYDVDAKTQEEEISSLLKSIETTAGKSLVVVTDVKLADFKSEKLLKKYSVSLGCEGTMEQCINFMFNLEHSKDLFTIENYQITSKDKEKGIVKCQMNISKTVIVS